MYEDIERLFMQDSRDKKRTGANVSKRASRRGYCRGGVKMPSDFLSTKQKKELNGEVKVSNVLDELNNIPTLEEIKNMDNQEAKRVLEYIKSKHTVKAVSKKLGISTGTLSYYYEKYGVSKRAKKALGGKFASIDEVPLLPSIKTMPVEKQFTLLYEAKNQFGGTQLARYWGVSRSTAQGLFKSLGLQSSKEEVEKKMKKINEKEQSLEEIVNESLSKVKDIKSDNSSNKDSDELLKFQKAYDEQSKLLLELALKFEEANKVTEPKKGLRFEFNGECSKEELQQRLSSLGAIAGDNNTYSLHIVLEEV